MAIEEAFHDDFGAKRKCVTVNKADSKHKNRVLSFLKVKNPLTRSMEFQTRAQWSSPKYHPSISLSRRELLQLANALERMAEPTKKAKKFA